MNDIFNRINMGMSQQSKILSGLNRPQTTTKSTSSTSSTKGKSFFSLASKPTSTTQLQSQNQSSNSDADLKTSYLLPPNAGVGFAPTPSASSATAEQKALRERLGKVGWKGGKRGEKDTGKGKKRAAEESESEEELGRSAVGKSRGKGKRVTSEVGEVKVVSGAVEAQVGGGGKEAKGGEISAPVEKAMEDVEMETVTEDTPVSISEETRKPAGEGKAKKKKKKEKKKTKGKMESESTES
jgi:hypothetical protein